MLGYKKPKSSPSSFVLFFLNKANLRYLVYLVALIICVERYMSYSANTEKLYRMPIFDIYRECPKPEYEIVSDKPNICITTLTDAAKAGVYQKLVRWRNFNNLLEITWPNKQRYADLYGYQLFNESNTLDTSRPPSWSKIKAVQRLLNEESCDWVFWMDADTVIMNSTITIESFLPANYDLVLSRQKGPSWNAGAWLIKNTEWSKQFLQNWWNMESFVRPKGLAISGDNDALHHYLSNMDREEFEAHITVPPRCNFNSVAKFMNDRNKADLSKKRMWYLNHESYHKGDFVAHIAGVDNKITTAQMLLQDAEHSYKGDNKITTSKMPLHDAV